MVSVPLPQVRLQISLHHPDGMHNMQSTNMHATKQEGMQILYVSCVEPWYSTEVVRNGCW